MPLPKALDSMLGYTKFVLYAMVYAWVWDFDNCMGRLIASGPL